MPPTAQDLGAHAAATPLARRPLAMSHRTSVPALRSSVAEAVAARSSRCATPPTLALGRSSKHALHRASRAARSARPTCISKPPRPNKLLSPKVPTENARTRCTARGRRGPRTRRAAAPPGAHGSQSRKVNLIPDTRIAHARIYQSMHSTHFRTRARSVSFDPGYARHVRRRPATNPTATRAVSAAASGLLAPQGHVWRRARHLLVGPHRGLPHAQVQQGQAQGRERGDGAGCWPQLVMPILSCSHPIYTPLPPQSPAS